MKKTTLPWNIKQLSRMEEKGSLNFEYPIQRKGGQWDDLQKSLLIHSIASGYPVPPLLTLKNADDDATYVLDGKQRITNIIDFVNDKYPLHESTPNAVLAEIGTEFTIAEMMFSELPEDVQSEILTSTMTIYRLEDATDDEIEELFYRWNNGTPLTKQQKARAKMGTSNAIIIDDLIKHPFLTEKASFTKLQSKRSDDEAVILQTMMLMSDKELESFVADKILKFATEMRNEDITSITDEIKITLDYLDDVIAEKNSLFKKLHLPTIILVAKKAYNDNVDADLFASWVDDFSLAINDKNKDKAQVQTDYKEYTGAGSVKQNKVLGRKSAMFDHFEKFIELNKEVVKNLEESIEEEVVEEPNAQSTEKEDETANNKNEDKTNEKEADELVGLVKEEV